MDETVTMADAVRRSSKSAATIRRMLHAGEIPGARREDPDNDLSSWVIPVAGLVKVGLFTEETPPVPDETDELPIPTTPRDDVPPEVIELREALAAEQRDRLAAEREQAAKELARLVDELDRSGREAQRLRSDVEQERTRADQAEREAARQAAATEIAEARAEEREREIGRLADDRDRRLAELAESRDRERDRAEAMQAERAEVEERLRAELADVRSVLGWRARRRLAKLR